MCTSGLGSSSSDVSTVTDHSAGMHSSADGQELDDKFCQDAGVVNRSKYRGLSWDKKYKG